MAIDSIFRGRIMICSSVADSNSKEREEEEKTRMYYKLELRQEQGNL